MFSKLAIDKCQIKINSRSISCPFDVGRQPKFPIHCLSFLVAGQTEKMAYVTRTSLIDSLCNFKKLEFTYSTYQIFYQTFLLVFKSGNRFRDILAH